MPRLRFSFRHTPFMPSLLITPALRRQRHIVISHAITPLPLFTGFQDMPD